MLVSDTGLLFSLLFVFIRLLYYIKTDFMKRAWKCVYVFIMK